MNRTDNVFCCQAVTYIDGQPNVDQKVTVTNDGSIVKTCGSAQVIISSVKLNAATLEQSNASVVTKEKVKRDIPAFPSQPLAPLNSHPLDPSMSNIVHIIDVASAMNWSEKTIERTFTFRAIQNVQTIKSYQNALQKPIPTVNEISAIFRKAASMSQSVPGILSSVDQFKFYFINNHHSLFITVDREGIAYSSDTKPLIVAFPAYIEMSPEKNEALNKNLSEACLGRYEFKWLSTHPRKIKEPFGIIESY